MANFHEGYVSFCSGKGVSQELMPLLLVVYNQIHASDVNLRLLKESLVSLISFLCQAEHRTDKNCLAVDLFFAIDDHWNKRWAHLPEEYQQVLDDIGGCLHDTVSHPDIAKNFEATPEQLLQRINQLSI